MAIQDDLAAALSAIAQATTALNSVGGQATDAIKRVGDAYSGRLATMQLTLHLNQVTGSDANPGTAELPLRSLKAAVAKAPIGGFVTVRLQSDYTNDEAVEVRGRFLVVTTDGSVKRNFTFGRGLIETVQPTARALYGFRLVGIAGVVMENIAVIMPPLDAYGAYQDVTSTMAFSTAYAVAGVSSVALIGCSLNLPTTPFGALLLEEWPVNFLVVGLTLNGALTSLNGRVVRGITNLSGTDPATLSYLSTNLPKI